MRIRESVFGTVAIALFCGLRSSSSICSPLVSGREEQTVPDSSPSSIALALPQRSLPLPERRRSHRTLIHETLRINSSVSGRSGEIGNAEMHHVESRYLDWALLAGFAPLRARGEPTTEHIQTINRPCDLQCVDAR